MGVVGKAAIGALLSERAVHGGLRTLPEPVAEAGILGAAPTRHAAARPLGGLTKRAVAIVLALVLLVLAAPILLLVATLIRLLMGGPVVFGHKRVGYQGRHFVCYKFRTMARNAQERLEQ